VLLAGKREQLTGKLGASLCCITSALQDAEDVFVLSAERREFDITENGGQQIVEIMRDAARQLTDNLQFLSLAKALLNLTAFGNIPYCACKPDRPAALISI
jgi:hypothetical protein